jgi:cell division protein FtsZ
MNTEEFNNITFDLPKNQSNVIKVIGVGGGGSNAINHMFQQGIKGVDFVICNTDAQALANSPIPTKIQLGVNLTEGLGAGANPEIGEQAAVESIDEIKNLLDKSTKMIFITAGMGGGTGTGAAPIIAKLAREMEILTVGIVTIPFQFEGKTRNEQAQVGVEKLRSNVDSLIVINNNKLREVYGNLGFKAGFSKADEVLATASRGIAEVITHHYTQNIDLRDAKTVLSNSGTAIMGSANASGSNRSRLAIEKALDSPLLNDNKIKGAKNVLLLIVSGKDEITLDEIGEINDHIQNEAGHSANIIMGVGEDETLEDAISVTVIATGFNVEQQDEIVNTRTKKIIHTLEDEQKTEIDLSIKNTGFTNKNSSTTNQSKDGGKILFQLEEVETEKPENHVIEDEDKSETNDELIETTQAIRDIEVVAEVVNPIDFEIIDKTEEVEDDVEIVESQNRLTFDLFNQRIESEPKKQATQTREQNQASEENESVRVVFDLEKDVRSIEVNEPEFVRRKDFSRTNFELHESSSLDEKVKNTSKDEDIYHFDTKVDENKAEHIDTDDIKEVDPLNSSINELKARAAERRAKMKQFNYRFSSQNIQDIEKQPAYKRAGIELDEPKTKGTKLSRTSLHDDNNDISLRQNNSYLHDNVD